MPAIQTNFIYLKMGNLPKYFNNHIQFQKYLNISVALEFPYLIKLILGIYISNVTEWPLAQVTTQHSLLGDVSSPCSSRPLTPSLQRVVSCSQCSHPHLHPT